MGALILPKSLDSPDVLLDARLEFEDEWLPALPVTKILKHFLPVSIVKKIPKNDELLFLGSQ